MCAAGENFSEFWFLLMQQVEMCYSLRTVLNLVAATCSLKHCFVISFIYQYFERKFTNYVIQLMKWGLSLIIMTHLILSMACSCIVHHKVRYSRIPLTGTNSDISALEERLKVLPSLTSNALSDSVTLHWIIWILLSPFSCYNGFRRLKGTAGKRKYITNISSEIWNN
jgi:hypothetical protein